LADIIAKTHFTIKTKVCYRLSEIFFLIQDHKGRNQDKRKSKLLPHIKSSTDCLYDYVTIALHNQLI
ncbi:hypothetical protein NE451_21795, partial [Bacteroides nordii]